LGLNFKQNQLKHFLQLKFKVNPAGDRNTIPELRAVNNLGDNNSSAVNDFGDGSHQRLNLQYPRQSYGFGHFEASRQRNSHGSAYSVNTQWTSGRGYTASGTNSQGFIYINTNKLLTKILEQTTKKIQEPKIKGNLLGK
jgi:hypothetical protein